MPAFHTYQGCTALVTGASMGLGAELARQLAARGARTLVLTARSQDRLEALAAELRAAHEVITHVMPLDLTASGACADLHARTAGLGLEVDLLVNNAGFGKWGPFKSRALDVTRRVIELNVQTLVDLTHRYGEGMLERGRGGILQMSSLAGFMPLPYIAIYAASKAFVTSFSEALWAQWRDRGVTVTNYCPGGTESEFHSGSGTWMGGRKFMPADRVVTRGLEALLCGQATAYASFGQRLQARVPQLFTRRRAALILKKTFTPPEGWEPDPS